MNIPELEAQLLRLDRDERLRLSQLLIQSLDQESPPPNVAKRPTLVDTIAQFRNNMSAEELEIDPNEIWGDVRDKTPADSEPRW
jgi:hypothetical protein